MFLDDTACNLASLNLLAIPDDKQNRLEFKTSDFEHACALVDHGVWKFLLHDGAIPVAKEIAKLSYRYSAP